jgi:hypothetical protein
MNFSEKSNINNILTQKIEQSNKITKNIFNLTLLIGSSGFLIAGVSSYFNSDLLWFLDTTKIIFYPQGLIMSLYGGLGLLLSINQIIIYYYNVGNGYNEFNKEKNYAKIFRKNHPIQKNNLEIIYALADIVRDTLLKKNYIKFVLPTTNKSNL